MSLKSFRSSNAILYIPTKDPNTSEAKSSRTRTLVFFITGNPGLISYYDEFLNIVSRPYGKSGSRDHDGFSLSVGSEEVIVAGFSLGGFVTTSTTTTTTAAATTATAAAATTANSKATTTTSSSQSDSIKDSSSSSYLEDELTFPPSHERKELYSLRDQIDLSYERLVYLVERIHADDGGDGDGGGRQCEHEHDRGKYDEMNGRDTSKMRSKSKLKVILIGHSVGAYMALEIVRLHHLYQHRPSRTPSVDSTGLHPSQLSTFTISSLHLLTPTIVNISHSPSGRIATPLLSNIPFFPSLIQLFSSSLTYLISSDRLEALVSRVTGMKSGSLALKSTVQFLRGKGMVQQALSMARDEMREIGENQWEEEVWGISRGVAGRVADDNGSGVGDQEGSGEAPEGSEGIEWIAPRLHFLFAKKDHWVADLTREEIIKGFQAGCKDQEGDDGVGTGSPGTGSRGPTFVVDETDGLVHAWCLEQSVIVAERVRGWIMGTLEDGKL